MQGLVRVILKELPKRTLLSFFFFFCGTGVSTHQVDFLLLEPHCQSIFKMVILEMGSHKLFAKAGFHDPSDLSLPSGQDYRSEPP
jgi:hypothetical protein